MLGPIKLSVAILSAMIAAYLVMPSCGLAQTPEPRLAPSVQSPHLRPDAAILRQLKPRAAKPSANVTIEPLKFSEESPLLGQTISVSTALKNSGDESLGPVKAQFYEGETPIGAPITLDGVAPGETVELRLPFRPRSLGRYSLNVVVSPAVSSDLTTKVGLTTSVLHRDGMLMITALPVWWVRLDQVFAKTPTLSSHANGSRVQGLATHSWCQNDIRRDFLLQKHGTAVLQGKALWATDQSAAEFHYADAVHALSKLVEALYCVDLAQLHYWDRAVAEFWRGMATNPLAGFSFDDAIIATWNPALMLVDAVQITGHSEILQAYSELESRIRAALKAYPAATFGAAWLDDFGSGKLVPRHGPAALANLQAVLSEPRLLGFGSCSLSAHANKQLLDRRCLDGVTRVTGGCTRGDLVDVLAGLHAAGMLLPLLQGNLAKAISNDPAPGTGTTKPVRIGPEDITYFGRPVADITKELCAKLKTLKPKSPPGLAGKLGRPFSHLDGCGFAMLMEGLAGPGGGATGRAIQCMQKYAPDPYRLEELNPVKVQFPATHCGIGRPPRNFLSRFAHWIRVASNGGGIVLAQQNDSIEFEASNRSDYGGKVLVKETFEDGVAQTHHKTEWDEEGVKVREFEQRARPGGGHTETEKKFEDGKLVKVTTTQFDDKRKKIRTVVQKRNADGTWERSETPSAAPAGRPIGPGEDGCLETAAQQRARAIFGCIFGQTAPVIGVGGTPGPVIYPHGPSQGLPAACNAIDASKFWGSSTSSRGGAWDPPPWWASGGPSSYETFIPEIDGVIDPPKSWTGIPQGSRGGSGAPGNP